MNTNTKAALITLGLPALGGLLGSFPGVLISKGGSNPTTKSAGLVIAVAGGLAAAFFTARAIIK